MPSTNFPKTPLTELLERTRVSGIIDGYSAAISDILSMRATEGVLTGKGLILDVLQHNLDLMRKTNDYS